MRHLVVAGGVAANGVLRAKLQARAVCRHDLLACGSAAPGMAGPVQCNGVRFRRSLIGNAAQAVAQGAGLELVVPPPQLCTDNGVMVAWAGAECLAAGLSQHLPVDASPDDWVDVRSRWPLTDRCATTNPAADSACGKQFGAHCKSWPLTCTDVQCMLPCDQTGCKEPVRAAQRKEKGHLHQPDDYDGGGARQPGWKA